MLKVSLTQTEFAALDDSLKIEYKLQTDGTYKIDLGPDIYTTDKDPAGLHSALEKEREENKRVRAIADELEKKAKQTELDGAKTMQDIREQFTKELDERDRKAAEQEEARKAELKEQREVSAKRLMEQEALKIATETFGTNAPLMLPHVLSRLQGVVTETGESVVQVIDPVTRQPALDQNLENLSKGLSTDPIFKSMVVVSNASGGSANGDGSGKGTLATSKDDGSPKKFADYNSGQLKRLKDEQPEVFKALYAEHTS